MKTLRNLTFLTFLGICSVWAAFADMLQNSSMFSGFVVALIGLGLLAFVLPASIIARILGALFGADAAIRFSIKPFGTSCLY